MAEVRVQGVKGVDFKTMLVVKIDWGRGCSREVESVSVYPMAISSASAIAQYYKPSPDFPRPPSPPSRSIPRRRFCL